MKTFARTWCYITTMILAGCLAAGFVGCNDASTSSGGGGTSGSATGGSAGNAAGSSGGAGGRQVVGGAGGAGACDTTYKCQQAITPPSNDPTKLCPGSVAALKFATLDACLCTGPCAAKCAANLCAQQMPSGDCLTCIMDVAAGCGLQAADCGAN